MAWTSWGSRRALRKCLVLSVIAHFGLALYGGTVPVFLLAIHPEDDKPGATGSARSRCFPSGDPTGGESHGQAGAARPAPRSARWDRPLGGLALADPS